MNKKQKKAEFKKAMQEIFTDDGDHTFFDNLLSKKFRIVMSIKTFSKVSNEELIITFASITKINQNRDFSLVIIEYIVSTEVAPRINFCTSNFIDNIIAFKIYVETK